MLTAEQRAQLVERRRDFHRHPELAHQEHRTAAIVAEHLQRLGLDEVRTGVGQTGIVGVLRGGRPGRRVMLRADMDALPLNETDREQPYRSATPGAHHACGHDGHTAILMSVAELLAARRTDLPGSVTFIFQPAEERVGGALGMVGDGALEPRPDACFGLHLWNELDVGRLDARSGPIYASADAFAITLSGPGGHAAMPHQVVDPVLASAQLIIALQTLVSRESPPLEPAVLTIGSIHGGTAPNIIPTRVELQGTLRVFDPPLREFLLHRLHDVVAGVAETFRVDAEVRMTDTCPATINDPAMTALVQAVGQRVVGAPNVSSVTRTMGAEDMSVFLNEVPGCFFFLGSANAERGLNTPHHSPTFDFDERALELGVQMLTAATLEFLGARMTEPELERSLPLFPLEQVVLYPGMSLPLRIFEERYKVMIGACQVTDQLFGVLLIRSGLEVGAPAHPERVGCTARMLRIDRLPDGQMTILNVGEQRFRLLGPPRVMPEGYLVGDVRVLADQPGVLSAELLASVRDEFDRYQAATLHMSGRTDPGSTPPELLGDPLRLSYHIASTLHVHPRERQHLLEIDDVASRLQEELALLRRENRPAPSTIGPFSVN